MLLYATKRLVYTLLAIPLVIFIGYILFSLSPIDPVERQISQGEYELEKSQQRKAYIKTAKNENLHLPPFYFTVNKSNYNSDYYTIIFPPDKAFYKQYLDKNYSFFSIQNFHNSILRYQEKSKHDSLLDNSQLQQIDGKSIEDIEATMNAWKGNEPLIYNALSTSYNELILSHNNKAPWIQRFMWFGSKNQYHQWLTNFFCGKLDASMRDGRSVYSKLWNAFGITLIMILMAFLFSMPLGIFLGKRMALYPENKSLRFLETGLFLLRSIPLFWLLTLALIFFTTPEYGKFFHLFPSVNSFGFIASDGLISNLTRNANQLILPIICISIYNLGYITRQVKTLVVRENHQPYITTARMKGLSQKNIQQHAYKNAKTQIITMISAGIASSIGGSVIVEYIYNIPGMGRLLLDSIKYSDFPMLMLIIIFIFVVTSIIFLIADILYMRSDPRIRIAND